MSYLDGRNPNASDVIAAFTDAMRQRGLIPPENLIPDGRLHRCRVEGARPSKRDGAYVFHPEERPAGGFRNWTDGQPWQSWRYSNGTTTWTPAERTAFNAKVAARKKADEEKRLRLAEAARQEAVAQFGPAGSADPRHAYLVKKQIKPHGIRQAGSELLVPRRDMRTGELVNLQRILPDGTKLNLNDGRVDDTWFIIGTIGTDAGGTIFLGEGFATCATSHEIVGHPAIVSFGGGNLKAAALELRRQHPRAKIVVLMDDDWRKPGNPGRTKATEAARSVDALLAVPEFGDAKREDKDSDFNDMARLVGADAVRAAIENATWVKREPPRPLTRPVDPAAEYPVDALGPEPAAAVRAIEARTQAPLALCAQAVLGTMSLATQGHRNVEMPGGRQRPMGEYLLALINSGGRKTSTDDAAVQPAREVEHELQTQYALDIATYKNEQAAWEQARKPSGKNTKNKTAALADLKAAGDEPTPPRKPIILVSEPTQEGLVKLLAEGQPSVGLFSAEGSQFIGGHGMKDDSRLRMAGTLSRLWDDGSADRVRGGDGAIKLYNKRLTISLATQPGNGLKWLASPDLADQGLFSRLLIVAPESGIGTRFITRETEARVRQTQGDLDDFHKRIKKLLEAVANVAELDPKPLKLSAAAHALWRDFSNAVEAEMAARGTLAAIRAFANKAGEHALRLAGILTAYRNHKASEIDAETVANAIELVQHYLNEAARISGMAAASEESRRAQDTLDFLRDLDHNTVHLAEVYQRGPLSVRNAATARAVMQMLADHGYVEPIPKGAEIDGQHRREAWRVLPIDEEAGR